MSSGMSRTCPSIYVNLRDNQTQSKKYTSSLQWQFVQQLEREQYITVLSHPGLQNFLAHAVRKDRIRIGDTTRKSCKSLAPRTYLHKSFGPQSDSVSAARW